MDHDCFGMVGGYLTDRDVDLPWDGPGVDDGHTSRGLEMPDVGGARVRWHLFGADIWDPEQEAAAVETIRTGEYGCDFDDVGVVT